MKTDKKLGARVNQHLLNLGIETPMVLSCVNAPAAEKIKKLTDLFTEVWTVVGMDLSDDSLADTPARMAKMYVNEIYQGLNYDNFPKCTAINNKMRYDEMLCEANINVQSNCEHHGVVISGKAAVAYIPGDVVIGLSKINRVVEFFAKRPQVQERLTEQIYAALSLILGTENVAVTIAAEHYCVKSRGIKDISSFTVTSKLGGDFRTIPAVRQEFYALARSVSPTSV